MKSRYWWCCILPGYARVFVKYRIHDGLRWTGVVGHAHWCCVSKHSPCAVAGGCSGSCNCNARRDRRFG